MQVTWRAFSSIAGKVKAFSPRHRLVIALLSPDRVIETGLRACSSEKKPQKFAPESTATLSPVRFESKSYGIAPISCNFQRNAGGFLCNPDCVAEQAVWR
jgi:hypothetical protein